MRVLLDENLPEALVAALRELGHEVESVNTLRLKGLDNGRLYREVAQDYDLCFTKDAGFADGVRRQRAASRVTLLRVALPQSPAPAFVATFVRHFSVADWSRYQSGDDWP